MSIEYLLENIAFEVPSLWSVREIDGAIEISDAQGQGALHLSILRRSKAGPLIESEARDLVDSFASNNGLVPESIVASKLHTSEARAIGPFRPIQPTAETPLHWLVGSVVWPDKAVRASYCTDSLNVENINLATAIIDSIQIK